MTASGYCIAFKNIKRKELIKEPILHFCFCMHRRFLEDIYFSGEIKISFMQRGVIFGKCYDFPDQDNDQYKYKSYL